MSQVTIIGCDLHDRSMLLKIAVGMEEPVQRSFVNDEVGRDEMLRFLIDSAVQRGSERIVFVYEASGQGYGLYDLLSRDGIVCYVLSPTRLPSNPKRKKQKTDPKDAMMLLELARAHVLAGNKLPTVWIPPQQLRNDRELVRMRLATAESCTQVKLQIHSMLKRYGRALPSWFVKSRCWTRRFVAWLEEQAAKLPEQVTPTLRALIERFQLLHRQIAELDKHVRRLAQSDRYRAAHKYLREMPGVGLLTAMTFLTEMGDPMRFSNRREVAAYLGLCPASFESGEAKDRKGHITRQGPGRVRKVLCQAAWAAIRLDDATRNTWERIKGGKKRHGKKATVAIMRKLAIKMWHLMLKAGVSHELITPPTPPPCWIDSPSAN